MTAALRKFKIHLLNWREWELNPIVIKELRQAVRSWSVPGALLTFLIVLFIITVTALANEGIAMSQSRELGARIFGTFYGVLAFVSIIFIPSLLARRVGEERQEANLDLLYVSTLSPTRIIRGKFYCGAYLAVLFFSACLPFMTFTNLLRGVDLPTIFSALFYLFITVCTLNQVAIFFACLPIGRALKVVMMFFGFFFGSWLLLGRFLFGPGRLFGVSWASITGLGWWQAYGIPVVIAASVTLLFYFLSVALISPHSANRAKPVRLFLTALWAFYGLWSLAMVLYRHQLMLLLPWATASLLLLALALLVVISNSDRLSARVRLEIPASASKRRLAYLFYNGAAGGIIWLVVLAGLTLGGLAVALTFETSPGRSDALAEYLMQAITLTMYVLAYALAGVWFHRRFFPLHTPKLAAISAMVLGGLWALVPPIILFFANRLSIRALEEFQPGNIANVFMVQDSGGVLLHLPCSMIFLLVTLILNLRWFTTQWRNFCPPGQEPKPTPPPIPG